MNSNYSYTSYWFSNLIAYNLQAQQVSGLSREIYEAFPDSKNTKFLNMYNIFNL
jgi:hypothetical protein